MLTDQSTELPETDECMRWRLGAVPRESGFRMDGWFVWCGSPIKVDDTYHLFASRWPEETGFPEGYRDYSEIVRATSTDRLGPYTFREVVVDRRGGDWWDGGMVHNPVVYRCGDGYALFHNASRVGGHYRELGVLTADEITGPWRRRDEALKLGVESDANNPAALFEADGTVRLLWRTEMLATYISRAASVDGPYELAAENIWPDAMIEDFSFFKRKGAYHILCEDNKGGVTGQLRWGARLISDDGVSGWRRFEVEPIGYDHTILFDDGTTFTPVRRERPCLLIEDGMATALFTAVYDGTHTWNQPVPITPAWPGIGGNRH